MNTVKYIVEAHQQAIDSGDYRCSECGGKGWKVFINTKWPNSEPFQDREQCVHCQATGIDQNKNIGELLMDIVGSLWKVTEAHRKNDFTHDYFPDKNDLEKYIGMFLQNPGKCKSGFETTIKDTFEDSLADVFIRLFDLMGYLKIEIGEIVDSSFNFTTDNLCNQILHITGLVYDLEKKHDWHGFSFLCCMLHKFCTIHNINIENHIIAKLAYSKIGAYRHGKENQ
jgi:hypothetical protein